MRPIRSSLVLVLLGLAACQQQTTEPPAEATSASAPTVTPSLAPSPTSTPAPAGTLVQSLAGAWRVAGIDGASFDEPYGLALTANETAIWWEPRCAGMSRDYRITGRSVSFTGPEPAPQAVCEIGLPPRLPEVFAVLDAAETIVRTPANGIEISGGGRSLTLFSQ